MADTTAAGAKARRTLGALGCIAAAALVPVVWDNVYIISVATLICLYAALAQCWNVVMGVAGIWSFAQVALFAVGAYGNVLILVKTDAPTWMGLLSGTGAALVVGVLIGLPSVRLRGVYVVLFTLAFQEIMRILIQTDDSGFTGGTHGLFGFDAFGLASLSATSKAAAFYYIALALLCVVAFAIYRVLTSPIGLAFRALRDAEPYATARGIDRRRFQIVVFAFTAALSGLIGAVYSDYVGTATPAILSFDLVTLLLAMLVIGGWGTFAGPIIGAIVVMVLSEKLRDINEWRLVVLAVIMLVMIVLLPGGLVGLWERHFQAALSPLARVRRWMDDE